MIGSVGCDIRFVCSEHGQKNQNRKRSLTKVLTAFRPINARDCLLHLTLEIYGEERYGSIN